MSEYQMLNGAVSEEEEEEEDNIPTNDSSSKTTPPDCDLTNSSKNSAVIKVESQSDQDEETSAKKKALSLEVQEISRGSRMAEDEVDKSITVMSSRPDPEGQTGSSPSSPNTSDCSGDRPGPAVTPGANMTGDMSGADTSSCSSCQQVPSKLSHGSMDLTKSPAFIKLKAELDTAREQLQSKEQQVDKLSKIRDEVETEVQELTASLFQEAHKMVGEANEKRVSTEKCLAEATMKIDGLETEVTALKALVLTSTPSQPNRHLHPQLAKNPSPSSRSKTGKDHRRQGSDGSGKPGIGLGPGKKLSFSLNASPRSNKSMSPTCHNAPHPIHLTNVVVGAGGLPGAVIGEDGVAVLDVSAADQAGADGNHTALCDMGADCDNSCGFYDEKVLIDPTFRQEYLAWKKAPTLDRSDSSSSSQFLARIYQEDIDPCLDFPAPSGGDDSSSTDNLKDLVVRGIHDQTICIVPLKNEEVVQGCPLLGSDRVLCKYMVKCHVAAGDAPSAEQPTPKEFRISQLARNRITAVCNLLNYLDYIKKGLVKSHHNEVYKEILQLRRQIVLAKLGFSPD